MPTTAPSSPSATGQSLLAERAPRGGAAGGSGAADSSGMVTTLERPDPGEARPLMLILPRTCRGHDT